MIRLNVCNELLLLLLDYGQNEWGGKRNDINFRAKTWTKKNNQTIMRVNLLGYYLREVWRIELCVWLRHRLLIDMVDDSSAHFAHFQCDQAIKIAIIHLCAICVRVWVRRNVKNCVILSIERVVVNFDLDFVWNLEQPYCA